MKNFCCDICAFSGFLFYRQAARLAEMQRDEQRQALEREANELKEREQQEAERRKRERLVTTFM